MKKDKKELPLSKLKLYQIIIISCLLVSLMMLNSNYVNEKRAMQKANIENSNSFNEFVKLRKLEESDNNSGHENSNKVCSMGSDDLVDYYKTGDLSKIGLENKEIECEDKDKDYMKALIALVRKNIGGDDNDNDNEGEGENNNNNINEEKNTDDSSESNDKDNLITYGKRILPILVFLLIGVLSIFGWFICCFCNCCNCCCCCCCKKPGCKIPCFIFTFIFFALVIAVCIYGLSQSNKIFTGIANTECSILKLLEQVVDGEIKQTTPRWIGVKGINRLLLNMRNQINSLKGNALDGLNAKNLAIGTAENGFESSMDTFDGHCYNSNNYPTEFTHTFDGLISSETSIYEDKKYVLDIIKTVGHKDTEGKYPDKTFLYYLNTEYSEVAEITKGYAETTQSSFTDILDQNSLEVMDSLDKAKDTLDKLEKPFDEINNQIGDKIVDYAELIDEKGKLVVQLVFGILMAINVALAVFLILIGLFSMKACNNCCCCRCLFKSALHILWNILALLMILTFLVGSILALVGRIGGDAMSLISYIMSKENFENTQNPLLLGEMGDAKRYLKICLHGNGNLESEFDLGDSLQSIENIDNVLLGIDSAKTRFNNIIQNLPAITTFEESIKNRTEFLTDEFGLLYVLNPETNPINLKLTLSKFNTKVSSRTPNDKETWGIGQGRESKICGSSSNDDNDLTSGEIHKFHISNCKPINRDWIANIADTIDCTDSQIKDYAIIISKIVDLASQLSTGTFNSDLSDLKIKYNAYMESYIHMLDYLELTIGSLIGELRNTVGDGSLFSFVNGKFIGTNIEIILKYLKYSLGKDLYTVGLCLIIVGCSLILSISSTILLNVIINISLETQKKAEQITPFQINNPGQGITPVYK